MDFDDELEGQRIDLLQKLDEQNLNQFGHEINSEINEGDGNSRGFLSDERLDAGQDIDLDLESVEEEQSDVSRNASSSTTFRTVPDTVLSAGHYNSALKDAISTTRSLSSNLKQPWETGPMKFLFSGSAMFDFDLSLKTTQPSRGSSEDATAEPEEFEMPMDKKRRVVSGQTPSFLRCVKATPDCGYIEKRRANRILAICKLSKIIEIDPERFSVGRTVLEETLDDSFSVNLYETVDLVLAMKSPGTINKRAGSMMLYLNWHKSFCEGSPFPIMEKTAAKYLMSMRREETFVSRGASFRESLRFFHYALGLDGALEACDSPRVKGAADVMLSGGDEWRPADPFTTEEVLKFHYLLDDTACSALDRLAAGNVLTMIYGRCRASDLSHVQFVKPDMDDSTGYLEFGTRFHKTSRNAKQKTKLLPIVLPVVGINGKNWVKTLLDIRLQLGLQIGDLQGAPWWPAPASADNPEAPSWCKRPVSSEEIG